MIKGQATIAITNIHTKKTQTIHSHNMVTNALPMIFGANPGGKMTYDKIKECFAPLQEHALGGILLFGQTITASPDLVIAPSTVDCIGHAGPTAYNGVDDLRGSYNQAESGVTVDGLKLVWDFATNQANGSVACICLTSGKGGDEGLGYRQSLGTITAENSALRQGVTLQRIGSDSCVASDSKIYATQDYIYIYRLDNTVLHIKRYYRPITQITLTANLLQARLTAEYDITLRLNNATITLDTYGGYLWIEYWYATQHYLLIVDPVTGSIVKEYDLNSYAGIIPVSGIPSVVMLDDYLYITNNDHRVVTKIHKDDQTQIETIRMDSDLYRGRRIGNRIYYDKGQVIDGAGRLRSHQWGNTMVTSNINTAYSDDGLICVETTQQYNTYIMYYDVYMPYLATINNLSTPITKTSDDTLKITYTLEEAR